MTDCITYIMLGPCSFFVRGQHFHPCPECYAPTSALLKALMPEVGDKASPLYDTARAILVALDAERAQGYARAMGEVVERCESTVRDYVDGRRWDTRIMGMCDEAENIAEWASEQAGD